MGKTDNGNWSNVNKEMATKAISLVNGVSVVAIKTANVVSDTKNGIEDQVKFWLAVNTPIFLSVANSKSFLMKEIFYHELAIGSQITISYPTFSIKGFSQAYNLMTLIPLRISF